MLKNSSAINQNHVFQFRSASSRTISDFYAHHLAIVIDMVTQRVRQKSPHIKSSRSTKTAGA